MSTSKASKDLKEREVEEAIERARRACEEDEPYEWPTLPSVQKDGPAC